MLMDMLKHRFGWDKVLRPFLYKDLGPHTGWSATLGTLCGLLFGVMAVTGVFLAMYYNPAPDKAYQSIDYIMRDLPGGAFLRGIHHWGAGAMVTVVFVHMMVQFFSGTYRAPREFTWVTGAVLFLITLMLGFTGYLLPWDMKAYWATVVSANIPNDIPVLGRFVSRTLLGGENISGLTLTRFYAIHTLVLPALLMFFALVHIYLIRLHGLAEKTAPAEKAAAPQAAGATQTARTKTAGTPEATEAETVYRFYPEHLGRSSLVFGAVFLGILALAAFGAIPREEIAGTHIANYLPRPEWYYMWLFQLLTYFPGNWEVVGSLGIPIIGVLLLFALPFLVKNPLHGPSNRPLAGAAGTAGIICIVYLTWMGYAGIRPYGQVIPLPDRTLTAQETRGLALYMAKECAYCHQISGRGGVRTGPDMANMTRKNRTPEYLTRYIKNPAEVSSSSVMPKYDLPDKDLEALAAFIRALDFDRHPLKTLSKKEADQLVTEVKN